MTYETYLKRLQTLQDLNLTEDQILNVFPEVNQVNVLKSLNLSEDEIKKAFNSQFDLTNR